MNFNDNFKKMLQDHNAMKSWHEGMAKASADSMQDHIKAAAWHESQANLIKGMTEVPLDPEEKKTTIPAGGGSSTSTPSSKKPASNEVPLDPKTLKKSDLVTLLSEHVAEHGEFDMDIETIANFLIND
jgi:hypothetical protein